MQTRALLCYASFAVGGALLGHWGLSSVLSEGVTVFGVLQSVSGPGMVLATAYEVVTSDDLSEDGPDGRTVWTAVGFATVGILGLLLETVA